MSKWGFGLIGLFLLHFSLLAATVTSTNDADPGSLPDAIRQAAAGETINIAVTGTIRLSTGELQIDRDLRIIGPGARILTVSGGPVTRAFHVLSGTVVISGLTVADSGDQGGGDVRGGGIYNSGDLTLSNVVLHSNGVLSDTGLPGTGAGNAYGGAIFNDGQLTIEACSIFGNGCRGRFVYGPNSGTVGDAFGGAIFNSGSSVIRNSTITYNIVIAGESSDSNIPPAGVYGGGICNVGTIAIVNCTIAMNQAIPAEYPPPAPSGQTLGYGLINLPLGSATLQNSIVTLNQRRFGGPPIDVTGPITSLGHNFVGRVVEGSGLTNAVNGDRVWTDTDRPDPRLGPLTDNGGPTWTQALLPDSPAIDAADDSACPPTDQRGIARPQGARCDIGAFEFNGVNTNLITGFTQTEVAYRGSGEPCFGYAVALDGDTLAAGAPCDNRFPFVDIFARTNGQWIKEQSIQSLTMGFGAGLALDKNTLAVGGIGRTNVDIFVRENGNWQFSQRLIANQETIISVPLADGAIALKDDLLAVGIPHPEAQSGNLYIYRRVAGTWSLEENFTIFAAFYLHSVAIAGQSILVLSEGRGSAFLLTRDGSHWTTNAEIVLFEQDFSFATDVAFDGRRIFATSFDSLGDVSILSVRTFINENGAWQPEQKVFVTTTGPEQGTFISGAGNRVVVGAPIEGGSLNPGAAYVLERIRGSWQLTKKLTPPAGNPGGNLAKFGLATALSGNTIAIGAPATFANYFGGSSAGAIYVHELAAHTNSAPIVECAGEYVAECHQSLSLTAKVRDDDNDDLTLVLSVDGDARATNIVTGTTTGRSAIFILPEGLDVGVHSASVSVSDGTADAVVCEAKIIVRDTTPPAITEISASPAVLWPPNHKMVPLSIRVAATDGCGAVHSKIIAVRSNQPQVSPAAPDWQITGDLSLNLRAARTGSAEPVYTVTVECSDPGGNRSNRDVRVTVSQVGPGK